MGQKYVEDQSVSEPGVIDVPQTRQLFTFAQVATSSADDAAALVSPVAGAAAGVFAGAAAGVDVAIAD